MLAEKVVLVLGLSANTCDSRSGSFTTTGIADASSARHE